MQNLDGFLNKSSLRSQIIFIVDLLCQSNFDTLVSFDEISRIFRIENGTLYSHYKERDIIDFDLK